ncbi:hypothetical protein PV326_001458 [Microctonus aethiopoides]|nr:hypothetical protein PV326_001458 [Microctonus aethiopoides]
MVGQIKLMAGQALPCDRQTNPAKKVAKFEFGGVTSHFPVPEQNNLLGGLTWSYDGQTNRAKEIEKFAFGGANFTELLFNIILV